MFPFLDKKPKQRGKRGESLPPRNEGPPDSERPSGLCPRCLKQSSFEIIGTLPVTFDHDVVSVGRDGSQEPDYFDRVSVLFCRHCRHGVAVIEEKWIGDKHHSEGTSGTISWKGIHWWPLPEAQVSSYIPEQIREVYKEAAQSLSAKCPRASVVMARRTLEALTVDKGFSKGNLSSRLDNMASQGILHPTLADWAREIRIIGNIGAHFDPIQAVSTEDARELINFLRELLKYLYELPAELQRRKNP